MPYVRKNYRRFKKGAKGRKKVSWYNRKYSAYDAGKYALSQIWKLKGLVNSEMYKKDTALTNVSIAPSCTHVTAVAIGDGDSDRTGNSIFVRSWNFNGIVRHNTSGATSQTIRISLIQDTQQIADTDPAYNTVYESDSPYAHLNSTTVGRFKILWSRTYTVDNINYNVKQVRINVPMRHHVRYNGSASTDVQKGGLYFCLCSDEPGANLPLITGEYRLSYHDN